MVVKTAKEFLLLLDKSNLLPPNELVAATKIARPDDPPDAIVQSLVQRGLLTGWQAERLLAGRRAFFLGRYKFLEQIAEGKMGSVYKVQQIPSGRVLAVKFITRKLSSQPDAIERFRREIQAVAALCHPNIVRTHDAEVAGNSQLLVMEYVAGDDLKTWVKREGALPIDFACEIARQAALGLQHIHDRGLVHRDIEPTNILVVADSVQDPPVAKILDLGMVRAVGGSSDGSSLTRDGQLLGLVDYLSPEQAESSKRVDIRSDIYALGCTLFYALTGDVPFTGESILVKLAARTQPAPLLRTRLPEAPAELEEVLARMLAVDPNDRYQEPADVALALDPLALKASPEALKVAD